MAFDASPSWSGFNYQGKVALFHAILLINAQPVNHNFQDYTLTLENTEDFEIALKGVPTSFHQVKAYRQPSYSKYSEALLGIVLELYKSGTTVGYLHSWKTVNAKRTKKDIVESIQSDFEELALAYDNCPKLPNSCIIEQAYSGNKKIPKKSSIIKLALHGKSEQAAAQAIKEIASGKNNAIARFSPYQYPDKKYHCDLDSINEKIKSQVSAALKNRGRPVTAQQLNNAFHSLLGQLDKHVIERHKNEGGAPIAIPFTMLLDFLDKDFENPSKEYLAYHFKNQFFELVEEFMQDEDSYEEPADETECSLKIVMAALGSLDSLELWKHFRCFCPHEYIDSSEQILNAFAVSKEGILFVLLKIFNTIHHRHSYLDLDRSRFTYRSSAQPSNYYLPTTMLSNYGPRKLARKVLENPNMNEILYEVGNLIYDGAQIVRLSDGAVEHTAAPLEEDANLRARRIDIIENLRLLPIHHAQAELDAD